MAIRAPLLGCLAAACRIFNAMVPPPGATGLLAAPFFEIPTATHWGDMLAHRVHPSDLSALSDHGETCRVPEATLARVPTRTPHIATLGTGSFLRLGLGHQEDRWKVTP